MFAEAQPPLQQRNNLQYFQPRPPATDFSTWAQAESAIKQGMTVKELVLREFTRTLPHPEDIACVKGERERS